ncbi:hypothetical protein [Mesorhizobium australafricanum]|uniref:Nucleoside phosphorylase domain-containing protein n=1 Tax=Mesorhizobium australafricanum TaxID=3072311 RepID=A0ABU4X6L3_9HYPH|nr:hypothetical protein [Mesorhizobium sp. VK3E]MDX8443704.1 hypothetical protein [Mesorhizobium sp. VK3E]
MTARNIFLHFANRELNKSTSLNLLSKRHLELFKIAATLSSGYLYAPFSQVHEQYANASAVQSLISALCAIDKLILHNEARDAYQFKASRGPLYGAVRDKYPFYFGSGKLTHEGDYHRLPNLAPTRTIKETLSRIVGDSVVTNIISSSEAIRIQRHRDFIKRTLDVDGIGATFSVYEEHPIEPKPAEVMFLGEISSRIYIRHQTQHTDTVVMTGVYNDPYVEDVDMYPLFDAPIQAQLLSTLGSGQIITDHEDTLLLCALVGDHHFVDFCQGREEFIKALFGAIKRSGRCETYPSHSIMAEIRSAASGLDMTTPPSDLGNAAALVSKLTRLIEVARDRIKFFGDEYESDRQGKGVTVKVAIHVATDLEEEVVRELIPAMGWSYVETKACGKVSYNRFVCLGRAEIVLIRSSAGSGVSNGSLYTANSLFSELVPKKLVSVGVCFGMDQSNQGFTDVIVSERIAHYEHARVNGDGSKTYRGERASADSEIISRARSLRAVSRGFKVHVGAVLSGDKLIDDQQFRDSLLEFEDKAIGGDMEAAGLAVACAQAGVGFAMIKGIADFAEKKDRSKQRAAAENAVRFALEIITGGFA